MLTRLYLAAARHSWRVYRTIRPVVDIDGIRLPIGGGVGLEVMKRMDQVEEILRFAIGGRSGAYVDVGASLGKMLIGLQRLGDPRQYIGIEPLLPSAEFVWRVISENDLSGHCSIHAVGLSDRPGVTELLLNSNDDVMATTNSVLRPAKMYTRRQMVPVMTGDMLLADVPEIAAIKIDVEGGEAAALRGLSATIMRCRPNLFIEILAFEGLEESDFGRGYLGSFPVSDREQVVERRRTHAREIEEILQGMDYEFFQIREGRVVPARPSESAIGAEDFLVLPRERSV